MASGEYLVTHKPSKAAYKVADPNNQTWGKDTDRFGYKMLMKMGWSAGKGLGVNEDGATEHVKVAKKEDKRGIGVDARGAEVWIAASSQYNSILARLNAAYGGGAQAQESEPAEDKKPAEEQVEDEEAERRRRKEARKERREKKAEEAAAAAEAEAQAEADEEKAAKKQKKEKREKKGKTAEEEQEERVESKEDEQEKEAPKAVVRHKYHKMLRAKTVNNYSADDLNAILGTLKKKEKEEEKLRLAAAKAAEEAAAEADPVSGLVPTVVAPTSIQDYFKDKLRKARADGKGRRRQQEEEEGAEEEDAE